jgi:hypothetical protein
VPIERRVSLVGFLFCDTWVRGMPVPLHRTFEEVNLRFYVERLAEDGSRRRAVVFIRELVPRRVPPVAGDRHAERRAPALAQNSGLTPFFSTTSENATSLPSGPLAAVANMVRPIFASVGLAGTMATMGVEGETSTVATPVQGLPPPFAAR